MSLTKTRPVACFVRARPEHAEAVAANIRDSDRAELAILGHIDPAARLTFALSLPGDARAVLAADGQPVALFGCAEVSDGCGAPWMLCARDIRKAARFIVKHGARRVRAWARRWPTMRNATLATNKMHHRFIEACGFVWAGEIIVNNAKFRVFEHV